MAMLYFVWYDDTPKKLASDKLQEAIAAYTARFNSLPNLVLAHANDQVGAASVTVRYERTVQPNTFWLGFEETADMPSA